MNHYLIYPIKDFRKRPLTFLSAFLICFAGMYITFSMLFMQYGAYMAQVRNAEQQYHICLPDLSAGDIDRIGALSYVESVSGTQYEDSYTAYIQLKNHDPNTLKSQCDRIITELGLDQSEAYANNLYYTQYGIPDHWINQEYYDLASASFYADILVILIPFVVFTVAGVYLSARVRIRSHIDEYASLRTCGFRIPHLVRMVVFQYSVVLVASVLFAFLASLLTLKGISEFTLTYFSDDFLLIENQIPIKETLITVVIFYLFFLLIMQGCRRLFKQNLVGMLNKSQEYIISGHKQSNHTFTGRLGIMRYNILYCKRASYSLMGVALKNLILFLLPLFFVAFSASVYGMREQANQGSYDYGIFYRAPYKVTDEMIHELQENHIIRSVTTMHPYGDGTYGGAYIDCIDGREEEGKALIENFAVEHSLLFTDDYHDALQIRKQSEVFSAFYLFQAGALFVAAIAISLSDAYFNWLKRTKEFAMIYAMGLGQKALCQLYWPELVAAILSFLVSIVCSFAVWIYFFGIPYVKPVFIMLVLSVLTIVYLLGHMLVCEVHRRNLIHDSLSEKMKEVFS